MLQTTVLLISINYHIVDDYNGDDDAGKGMPVVVVVVVSSVDNTAVDNKGTRKLEDEEVLPSDNRVADNNEYEHDGEEGEAASDVEVAAASNCVDDSSSAFSFS